MNAVFEKTRELGEALTRSDEYQRMKGAEERALANAQAAFTMGQYIERKQQIQDLLVNENPDTILLKRLSEEMDGFQESLQEIEDIVELNQARAEFSALIEQVNKVLRFIVTGEMSTEGSQCAGSCASCGGGCGHNHLN